MTTRLEGRRRGFGVAVLCCMPWPGLGLEATASVAGTNNGLGPQGEGKGWSGSFSYKQGNLFVATGYPDYLKTGGVSGTATENVRRKAISLGASYDFGAVKVFGLFANGKDTQSGVAVVDTTTSTTLNNNIYWLGVSVPFMNKHTFKAVYAKLDERLAQDRDSTQIGLGYEYALDKQTDLYEFWARATASKRYVAQFIQPIHVGDMACLGMSHCAWMLEQVRTQAVWRHFTEYRVAHTLGLLGHQPVCSACSVC